MVRKWIIVYGLTAVIVLSIIIGGERAVQVFSEGAGSQERWCIVLDAGHGGEDGGATSCTGVLESGINLKEMFFVYINTIYKHCIPFSRIIKHYYPTDNRTVSLSDLFQNQGTTYWFAGHVLAVQDRKSIDKANRRHRGLILRERD